MISKWHILRVYFFILAYIRKDGIIRFPIIKFQKMRLNSGDLLSSKTETIRSIIPEPVAPDILRMEADYGLSEEIELRKYSKEILHLC